MVDIPACLTWFGADPAALHLLDNDGPQLLPYATLITARRNSDPILGAIGAVYEWQAAPLIFLVDADLLQGDDHLHRMRRLLAMRGDAPYLGVVAPGRLDVYRIALDKHSLRQAKVELTGGRIAFKQTVLARLGNERPQAAISQRNWISNVVLNLLTASITKLIKMRGVSDEDAISLVGRALFTRFLADRNLLPSNMSASNVAASLFDTRNKAARTSKWLDDTFNGDLLPLSPKLFARLPERAFHVLGDVLRRAPDSQLFLGWEEKWDNLDFAHIPVGVLSQAYELYLRNHAPARQRREGGYYTPRAIADLMVRASFRALERRGSCKDAKVLDPAAGAGVFLLTAFRELVAERWRSEGRRPDTKTLRAVLYRQVVGFDINEAALRFAALGLYLLSIELDPNPRPVDKLRFQDLRGKVLHRIASDGEESAGLGSLGTAVDAKHVGQYDLVIGNPPWTTGTKLRDWQTVRSIVGRIATSRGITQSAPLLPNECLDLPFVWRAMEWAKPEGQIAFALHARLLFQQGDGMAEARKTLFQALDIKSIINGVELRMTKVWPEISAPFCILIATNAVPHAGSGFRLISPHIEQSLNDAGGMRIDALNAEVVPSNQLTETPELLKILFRGTKSDLGIVERIRTRGHPTLETFWRLTVGTTERGQMRGSGNGYQKLRPSSRLRQNGDGLPGASAQYLRGRPEVTAATFTSIHIDVSTLDSFSLRRIHDPRSPELFSGPLLLVHKSPPASAGRVNVAVCDDDVVFNETYYGYSPLGHPAPRELVRYLALVLGSKLTLWMALVTSGEFGFEREVIEKTVIDRIPIPNFDELAPAFRSEITPLFEALRKGKKSWKDVDAWVGRLYGLGERDLQVISDTLEFNLPFAENKQKAQERPKPADVQNFCQILSEELQPWSQRFGNALEVHPITPPSQSPWYGIELRPASIGANEEPASDWNGLLQAAQDAAASEVFLHDQNNGLLIGRLAQQRYWSSTQARLLAQRIIWSHLGLLKGRASA